LHGSGNDTEVDAEYEYGLEKVSSKLKLTTGYILHPLDNWTIGYSCTQQPTLTTGYILHPLEGKIFIHTCWTFGT
jgi:hypothetical protein